MDRMDRILGKVQAAFAALAGLLLLFVTLSICTSIALRALNLPAPLWSVQFNEYSLLWITFLGGAWLLRRNKHVALDVVSRRLTGRPAAWLRVFQHGLGVLVCGSLTCVSSAVAWNHFQRGIMDVRAVDVPKHAILAVVCVGFLLMALQFALALAGTVASLRTARGSDAPGCPEGG